MRRISARLPAMVAVVLLVGAALQGCAAQTDDAGRLLVCASFSTMADFTGKIGGERVEVVTMAPTGAEPHDWEPAAGDIAWLERCEVLVLNGAGFEHWAEGVLPSLKNAPAVVDTSAGILLLDGHGGHGEEHARDPHVWLDPMNAKVQMEAIRDALVAADPAGEAVYRANFDREAAELDRLDEEYRGVIGALPGRDIVVAHEAFGYLCAAYGLSQVAAQGLSPEGEPDPARMAGVIDYAKSHEVRVIFFEETASPRVAEAIAREIGAETAVLSPIESLGGGEDYYAAMRRNLEQLRAALG